MTDEILDILAEEKDRWFTSMEIDFRLKRRVSARRFHALRQGGYVQWRYNIEHNCNEYKHEEFEKDF